jgi:hypothetical protein
MIVLVCGARTWTARLYVFGVLQAVHDIRGITQIVEGCADGADTHAYRWAKAQPRPKPFVEHEPAPWGHLARAAGPYRNRAMLRRHDVGLVLAFHEAEDLEALTGSGTADMVRAAKRAGLPTYVLPRDWQALKAWL